MCSAEKRIFTVILLLFLTAGCDPNVSPVEEGEEFKMDVEPPPGHAADKKTFPGKLKTGLALAQTLPEGTSVGFSADYEIDFIPNKDAQYAWEIRKGNGEIARVPIQLDQLRGNLRQFLPVRPEEGPFSSRLVLLDVEARTIKPLTDWAAMR